jgi:hypothetical protein
MHTAEPLVPEPSPFELEIATEKLKSCKLLGADRVPTELTQPKGETVCSEIHKHTDSVWNKKGDSEYCRESIIVYIYMKGDKNDRS